MLSNFSKEIEKYSHTKSALHVSLDKPLPQTLITKLVKARISQCPVQQGRVSLGSYAKQDKVWRELGLAAPARRALIDAKLIKLNDLKKITLSELLKLHGMGPSAIATITKAMKTKKISFASKSK